jgi:hypothetical protein
VQYAPIGLFVYNRPEHASRVLDALARNEDFAESPLFVFSDAPRRKEDEQRVAEVRKIIWERVGRSAAIIESPANQGIAESIRSGVSRLVEEFGSAIVVEDDLITGRCFVPYMNAALRRYRLDERVWQICGFTPATRVEAESTAFFCPLTSSWGWATWDRVWRSFLGSQDEDYRALRHSADLRKEFDLGGRVPNYFVLGRSVRGVSDSWATPFQAHVFLRRGLALWPARSLVRNIGNDRTGTHGKWFRKSAASSVVEVWDRPITGFPEIAEVDPSAWQQVLESVDAALPRWYSLLAWWSERVVYE